MSQWNNSYAYNNQYQGANTWEGGTNDQYSNQAYHPNRQYNSSDQYVSFNEFLSQMQHNGAVPANTANYSNGQYQNYDYNYQNMPSSSVNTHGDTYYGSNSSTGADCVQNQYTSACPTEPTSSADYSKSEVVLKSNLTATATEFVPKRSNVKPATSVQNIPEASSSTVDVTSEPRKVQGSSSDTNWRERPRASQNGDTNHRGHNNHRDNYRHNEAKNRNRDNYRDHNRDGNRARDRDSNIDRDHYSYNDSERDSNRDRYQDNSSRYDSNQESYNRNERNQSKSNFKGKKKEETDAGRTFYNSRTPGGAEERVRNGKEGSGRGRNWAGSQRIRATDRNYSEDEQYASNYLQYRDERPERPSKSENVHSPVNNRNKNSDQDKKTKGQSSTEMTQRERLSEQLDKGTLECLVCCERVKQTDPVWSCANCYHVLHLRCIRKWAISSMVEGKWRCPACQNTSESIPTEYRCMCGAIRSPEYVRGASGAHTCGKSCKRQRNCPHPCTLLCHPGPCPPCQATVNKQCGCGAETRSVLCSSKLAQVCGRTCHRTLSCEVHTCQKECHEGPCDECNETVTQVCYCPGAVSRSVACARESGRSARWSCGAACARVLACGAHVCGARCHPPPCARCLLLPDSVRTCPCGKRKLDKDIRKSCTDPIPLCGNICAKPLECGPAGDKHFCKLDCHEGPCPTCPDKTLLQCRCGHSSREVPCADLPQMYNNVLCQKKCNKKLSCGRHRCRATCCAATSHRCTLVCGRSLTCQLHRCEHFCHTGHCPPCPRVSWDELRCECGTEVLLPPIRCGARPPACGAQCSRARPCGHEPLHACHAGDCPPCVVLTTKRCHGGHEERKTIPCSQEEFSCGLPCGKPLPCGKHTCIKTCHKGPCDTGKCTQPCNEKRASCGHACAAPCHAGAGAGACPSAAPCRQLVRATCPCGRRHAARACHDNARDQAKMMSALAATKMQEGGSVDLSDVQRPANMLKTLECDDACRMEARARQLALALQIRNPDVSAKLAPRYSETLRGVAARDPAFAQQVHDHLSELVQKAKKSKQKTRSHSFPSMNWQKRQFIHEMCEHFGCESVAYDAEPNRNVVATADREKSWLPAMSILEVVSREAGKRRVPGPVLRTPAQTNKPSSNTAGGSSTSGSGWATLTSTNAWAARSNKQQQQTQQQQQPQPQQQPQQQQQTAATPAEKIDYFDNPPDN